MMNHAIDNLKDYTTAIDFFTARDTLNRLLNSGLLSTAIDKEGYTIPRTYTVHRGVLTIPMVADFLRSMSLACEGRDFDGYMVIHVIRNGHPQTRLINFVLID